MSKSKERIRDSQLRYKQGLGQNFIYDDDLLSAIAEASGVTEEDDVVEIGPGSGTLTKHLCRRAHAVMSVELDERLIPILRVSMEHEENFTLVEGDALSMNYGELTRALRHPYSVVANIPYYITTPLIMRLLEEKDSLHRIAVMVQKEVADKILSSPGDEGWGMLAVKCQYYCEPFLAMDVPASCFTPVPKVDSAFVVMPVRRERAVRVQSEEDFFRIAQAAFALRRKTMTNGLCAALHLERDAAVSLMEQAGLDTKVRGEKLTLEELGRLADAWTQRKAEENA
ncbi:MAG: 16S rRNA (adenine(1518)-N(6)/adenine(1519)-N(6))-dimethyltransferase RsmA [Clostridia bacterium]|nr:16S rRNA (adenine(1518)-N(6)/adenine(1519)-N(6))-dimethyltransferase RsmA [Clostridia bacterium]